VGREAPLQLANRLRGDRPVDVPGVAIVQLLLTDGRSRLYFEHAFHGVPFFCAPASSASIQRAMNRFESRQLTRSAVANLGRRR
jgi:hypothetical protein